MSELLEQCPGSRFSYRPAQPPISGNEIRSGSADTVQQQRFAPIFSRCLSGGDKPHRFLMKSTVRIVFATVGMRCHHAADADRIVIDGHTEPLQGASRADPEFQHKPDESCEGRCTVKSCAVWV